MILPHTISNSFNEEFCSKIKELSSASVHLLLNEVFSLPRNFPL